MKSASVVILGGGVAGLVAALALQRQGLAAEVFEAHAGPGEDVGAFFTIAVNGLRALRGLDCLDAVVARGFLVPRMAVWSGTGKLLGEVPRSGSDLFDTPSLTVKRGQFVAALREVAEQRGVRVTVGKRLVGVEGGRVRFADGSEAAGDVIVGADGLRSRLRRVLDPGAPAPVYTGLVHMWGTAQARDVEVAAGTFHMVLGRRGFFGYVRRPDGPVWWMAQFPRTPEPTRAELDAVPMHEWRRRLLALAEVDATPMARLIEASEEVHRPGPGHSVPPIPVWQRDGMVVIGDAAHAVGAGQGASLAIEDGVVLARCLREIGEPAAALARYERLRRPRVARMLEGGKANSGAKQLGPLQKRVADVVMPLFFRFVYPRATRWLYTYDAGAVGVGGP